MSQEYQKWAACLAYYGMSAPSQQVVDAIATSINAAIGDVVEITDEAFAQGSIPPALTAYSCIVLVIPSGEQDEVRQDCLSSVQRTLGKTVQGTVWVEVQGETQRIRGIQFCDEWIPGPPLPQSDGVHFTVELTHREPGARWELMERGWESPNQFNEEDEAELVARLLALRHDGDMDTRVVSPVGVVLTTFRLQKYLATWRRGTGEKREALSPHVPLPMLHEARDGYRVKKAGKRTS